MPEFTGYAHPHYALSLKEFGEPRPLVHCGGWAIQRKIPGVPERDAMGCYPLFSCKNWRKIHIDLEEIKNEIVCISLVTDPFHGQDTDYLRGCFPDKFVPFKKHYIADLQHPPDEIVKKRHGKNARRALKNVEIDVCLEPWRFIDEWTDLYNALINRHQVKGIRRFSRDAFLVQLRIPNTVLLRALHKGKAVGAQIYFLENGVAYCHLGAASLIGYELGAFYALDFYSLQYFSDKAKYLCLGGGSGAIPSENDGLSAYKKGWSTETKQTYLYGRIFDKNKYMEIINIKKTTQTEYFPSYRSNEFQ